jgi:hypothetical protein
MGYEFALAPLIACMALCKLVISDPDQRQAVFGRDLEPCRAKRALDHVDERLVWIRLS